MANLKRNAFSLASSQLAVAGLQALQFFLIARALGPAEFGKVAAVGAIVSVLMPFAGVGTANVMVMHLAQGKGSPGPLYGNSLLVASVSGIALVVVAAIGGSVFLRFDQAWMLLIVFGISELLFSKYVDVSAHVFYGLDAHGRSGLLYATLSLARLAAASLYTSFADQPGAQGWVWAHLIAGILSAVAVVAWTSGRVGPITTQVERIMADMRTGVFFSIGLSSRSIYTDFDKAVLARNASLEVTGAYTVAFRLISMATTPMLAMFLAYQTRMFRYAGEEGLKSVMALTNRLMKLGVVYAAALALGAYVAAPLLPLVFGDKYTMTVEMLRYLALLPVVQLLQSGYADALMAAGKQHVRAMFQIAIACISVALNLTLIPAYSWHGAIFVTYASQALLLILVVGSIFAYWRPNALDKP